MANGDLFNQYPDLIEYIKDNIENSKYDENADKEERKQFNKKFPLEDLVKLTPDQRNDFVYNLERKTNASGGGFLGAKENGIFFYESDGLHIKDKIKKKLEDKKLSTTPQGLVSQYKLFLENLKKYIESFDDSYSSKEDYPGKFFLDGANIVKIKCILLYKGPIILNLTGRDYIFAIANNLGLLSKGAKSDDYDSPELNLIVTKYLNTRISDIVSKYGLFRIGFTILDYINEYLPLKKPGHSKPHLPTNGNGENKLEEKQFPVNDFIGSNILYYGVPGCGKSYNASKEVKKYDEYDRILFHPDYTYSDFVGQLLPIKNEKNNEITYEFVEGPFTKILREAINNPDKNYCLVIEEINRGNASAIFGDIFQLLDRLKEDTGSYSKGDSEYPIKNTTIAEKIYGKGGLEKEIIIPHNLSLIATMNSSDQNVFVLDTAFKRRWLFKKVSNEFDDNHPFKDKEIGDTGMTWELFVTKINEQISLLSKNGINGDDKQIGKFFVSEDDLDNKEVFAEKVLLYLWEDVVKFNKTLLFKEEYTSIDKLIKGFKVNGFAVFNDEIFGDNSNGNLDGQLLNE